MKQIRYLLKLVSFAVRLDYDQASSIVMPAIAGFMFACCALFAADGQFGVSCILGVIASAFVLLALFTLRRHQGGKRAFD